MKKDENREEDSEDITARFGVKPIVEGWRLHFTYYRKDYIMEGVHDSRRAGSKVSWLWSVKDRSYIPMDTEEVHSDLGRAEVVAHQQIDKWLEANRPTRSE